MKISISLIAVKHSANTTPGLAFYDKNMKYMLKCRAHIHWAIQLNVQAPWLVDEAFVIKFALWRM